MPALCEPFSQARSRPQLEQPDPPIAPMVREGREQRHPQPFGGLFKPFADGDKHRAFGDE